jgi:hypothetical protein
MIGPMRWTFALFLAFAALAAPARAAERTYSITDFERVVVEGPFIVRLTTGRSTTARASGTAEAIDRLSLVVSGQTLRIRQTRLADGRNRSAQAGPVTIELTTRRLHTASLLGPGSFDIDRIEGLRVDISVQGSGRIRATHVEADNLIIGVLGTGTLELSGTAEMVRATVYGSATLAGSGLSTDEARILANTLGDVSLTVAREADITAEGLGPIAITGRATCNVRGVGASQVSCASYQRQQR